MHGDTPNAAEIKVDFVATCHRMVAITNNVQYRNVNSPILHISHSEMFWICALRLHLGAVRRIEMECERVRYQM